MRLRHIPGAEKQIEESTFVIQEPEQKKGCWAEVFGNENPIHIEVGMGKGKFLMELAFLPPKSVLSPITSFWPGISPSRPVLMSSQDVLSAAASPVPDSLRSIADAHPQTSGSVL